MKIKVTYEKADILRLVNQDIKTQGIRVKAGSSLEYKGPLQVRFEVETDEDVAAVAEPAVPDVKTGPPAPRKAPDKEEETVVDMSGVLAASQHLSRTTKPIYADRKLLDGESTEYPKE